MVAISSTSSAGTAVGSYEMDLWMIAASFISCSKSQVLLHGAPSVPSPMFTPAFCRSGTRQMPDASFAFEVGQCATLVFVSASFWMSESSRCTMWTRTVWGPRRPTDSQYDIGVWPHESKKTRSALASAQCIVMGMFLERERDVISLYRFSETLSG